MLSAQVVGETIRRLRKAAGLSGAQLGKAVGYSNIAMIENGHREVDIEMLGKIAKTLGVTVADLMTEPAEPRQEKRA